MYNGDNSPPRGGCAKSDFMLCLPRVGCAMALPLLLQAHVVMSDPERLARLGVPCVKLYTTAGGGAFRASSCSHVLAQK